MRKSRVGSSNNNLRCADLQVESAPSIRTSVRWLVCVLLQTKMATIDRSSQLQRLLRKHRAHRIANLDRDVPFSWTRCLVSIFLCRSSRTACCCLMCSGRGWARKRSSCPTSTAMAISSLGHTDTRSHTLPSTRLLLPRKTSGRTSTTRLRSRCEPTLSTSNYQRGRRTSCIERRRQIQSDESMTQPFSGCWRQDRARSWCRRY